MVPEATHGAQLSYVENQYPKSVSMSFDLVLHLSMRPLKCRIGDADLPSVKSWSGDGPGFSARKTDFLLMSFDDGCAKFFMNFSGQ